MMNRYIIFCLFFFISKAIFSQESSSQENERVKIDGVAAVIGEFIGLDCDIDKQFAQLRVSGVSTKDITRCQIFGKLLEDKLYQHHAIQDSIIVNNSEIQSYVDQQIDMFAQQIGSMDKLIEYYNKSSEQELRSEMFELNKNSELAKKMQESIIEDIEITPEEVRQFFNLIPKQDRPIFGTELRVSQIVIIPKTTDEEKQKVVDKLKQFKVDVVESGASFVTKVVLYSDDIASRKNGGKYTINRKRSPMVKEFNEVAFSLEEGEISEPFESEFGYHIIFLEKIRGQEYDVRHILLRPNINSEDIKEAKDKIENIRERIVSGDLTFSDAAKEASEEKETKFDGGLLINPETQDYSFELTKMDPELYSQISNLKEEEVSIVYQDEDRVNPIKFKILSVSNRYDEHVADYSKDYLKIQKLALQSKQLKEIEKWQDSKITETFVKVSMEHRDCNFYSNWLKK